MFVALFRALEKLCRHAIIFSRVLTTLSRAGQCCCHQMICLLRDQEFRRRAEEKAMRLHLDQKAVGIGIALLQVF